ncbi:hypothetical protein ACO1NJ_13915, partial [Staphylococcus aureus]
MEEKDLFEGIHKKKTKVMMEYYSKLQDYHEYLDHSDGIRKRKSRNVVAAAAAIAVADVNNSTAAAAAAAGGAAGGGPQRRLWVKTR